MAGITEEIDRRMSEPYPAPSAPADARAPASSPSVLVVLINWNGAQETIACLRSVLRMAYPDFSVLLIDNGSSDDSVEQLRPLVSDRVQLIELPTNTGFTGGSNLGFQYALNHGHDFVWLLNSDALTDGCTLDSLIRVAQADPRIALVSPRIASLQNPDKNLNLGGLFRPEIPTFQLTRDLHCAQEWARTDPGHVLLMGTALLVRTDLIRRIGPFDESLFAYWEDTDLSLRATKAGFRNAVDFASVILHHEKDATLGANDMKPHYWYYMARNETRFWRKHVRGLARAKALWWAYKFNLRNLALLGRNEPSQHAVIAGLWDGWIGRTGPFLAHRRAPSPIAVGIRAHARRHAHALALAQI